jgi:hypothetical protein
MKKVLFALAIAGLFMFVACQPKENKPAEGTTDSTAIQTPPADTAAPAVADTTAPAK